MIGSTSRIESWEKRFIVRCNCCLEEAMDVSVAGATKPAPRVAAEDVVEETRTLGRRECCLRGMNFDTSCCRCRKPCRHRKLRLRNGRTFCRIIAMQIWKCRYTKFCLMYLPFYWIGIRFKGWIVLDFVHDVVYCGYLIQRKKIRYCV